jgi:hypothetical protein
MVVISQSQKKTHSCKIPYIHFIRSSIASTIGNPKTPDGKRAFSPTSIVQLLKTQNNSQEEENKKLELRIQLLESQTEEMQKLDARNRFLERQNHNLCQLYNILQDRHTRVRTVLNQLEDQHNRDRVIIARQSETIKTLEKFKKLGLHAPEKVLGAQCCACYELPATMAFVHGENAHLCMCQSCSLKYNRRDCPMCNTKDCQIFQIY